MKPIITVQGLSKEYKIGVLYPARESSARSSRLLSRWQNRDKFHFESIWALKDVSFEIAPGEVVGIIGRNGAGKSTLLKILSRVTEPTTGRIELYGRIGSLLEVGTGFHPELSGRENVFLNGAILGMPRAEIQRKFDEIVAFSGIEKFIDTPVKWYSSGMYLRLAFSVSAHLEPDILILDEVLAVGDSDFQHKCLKKMAEIQTNGSTILFVSHSMEAMARLCSRAILFADGKITEEGAAEDVAKHYLGSFLRLSGERVWGETDAPGNDVARLRAVRVRTEGGLVSETVDIRKPIGIEMDYDVLTPGHVLRPNFHFFNEQRAYLFVSIENDESTACPRAPGSYTSTVWIPGNLLADGVVIVTAALSTIEPETIHFNEAEVLTFKIVDSFEGGAARGDYKGPMSGAFRPKLPWVTALKTKSEEYAMNEVGAA